MKSKQVTVWAEFASWVRFYATDRLVLVCAAVWLTTILGLGPLAWSQVREVRQSAASQPKLPKQPNLAIPVNCKVLVFAEMEIDKDGNVKCSQLQQLTAEKAAQLAIELARVDAGAVAATAASAQLSAPKSNNTAASKPVFKGQCEATARSTGNRCRQRACPNEHLCHVHGGSCQSR